MADSAKAIATPRMVSVCEAARPMRLPPKAVPKIPASADPAKGASGTAHSIGAESI